MAFTLKIGTANAAFHEDDDDDEASPGAMGTEVARILRRLAGEVREAGLGPDAEGGKLMDANGNHVGEWHYQP